VYFQVKICNASIQGGKPALWVVEDNRAIKVAEIARLAGDDEPQGFQDMGDFLEANKLEKLSEWRSMGVFEAAPKIPLNALRLSAPVSPKAKIFCAAYNYRSHTAETKANLPSAPYFFLKCPSAVNGPFDPIIKPAFTKKMDYEIELAVMIGRKVKNVAPSEAMNCVAGYLTANDVSFRDFQFTEENSDLASLGRDWVLGKGLDTAFPIGPWLVTTDESCSGPFTLECRVNGKIVQHATTDDMIFNVAHLLARASKGITLNPGDVISTGTPSGVALGGGQPYLKAGDVVEGSISGIGTIRNQVVDG
jgi:2-keto-4-pentenoate hydratase/2-oxohepta-3-ene-1,7-dioic acid hydratase in catechol pathway